jgi:ABC-type glutathione transport system ATPase component
MTMLIATHEMGFARDVADEVCFLHEGRIHERGDPGRVLTAPQRPETLRRWLRDAERLPDGPTFRSAQRSEPLRAALRRCRWCR